jgi:ribosomal protein S18 acetylase RimI-like enzyme
MHSIRRLNVGEATLYREIRLQALKESPGAFTTTYESALNRDFDSWIAQADGSARGSDRATFIVFADQPIGLAALYRDPDPDHAFRGELIQVWVSADYRGSSVATELLDHIFEWASHNNFRLVRAQVTPANSRAFHFYEKYGFQPVGSDEGIAILTKEVQRRDAGH